MFDIHFVSLNSDWVQQIQTKFKDVPRTLAWVTKVQNVRRQGTVFVSPSNSLGFMDGGIDYSYSREMFPRCEGLLRDKIRDIGHTTALGRPYLRVGSAVWISLGSETAMIAAPTMFMPQDVSDTLNAYHSFMAALMLMKKYLTLKKSSAVFHTLVVTSHGCGYGHMTAEQSAVQMYEAYCDWAAGRVPVEVERASEADVLILPSVDDEQPENYDNREIRTVSLATLR